MRLTDEQVREIQERAKNHIPSNCSLIDAVADLCSDLLEARALSRKQHEALKGVAPNWDHPTGYCYCSPDAFHDDDGECRPA